MAQTLLLGSLPQGHPAARASFLIVTGDRMEPISLAEGDVGSGALRFEGATDGERFLSCSPTAMPDLQLEETIEIDADGMVSTVTIRGISIDNREGPSTGWRITIRLRQAFASEAVRFGIPSVTSLAAAALSCILFSMGFIEPKPHQLPVLHFPGTVAVLQLTRPRPSLNVG